MKVYVSGPRDNRIAFVNALVAIEGMDGCKVTSHLQLKAEQLGYAEKMDKYHECMKQCTATYVLNGWEDDFDARREVHFATELQHDLYFERNDGLRKLAAHSQL